MKENLRENVSALFHKSKCAQKLCECFPIVTGGIKLFRLLQGADGPQHRFHTFTGSKASGMVNIADRWGSHFKKHKFITACPYKQHLYNK